MAEKLICNKENGCFSELFGRDCWVANSMLDLIDSYLEDMWNPRFSKEEVINRTIDYIKELKEKNKNYFEDYIDA